MATYSLHKIQVIPCTLEKAWDFFSDPANLQAITPLNMGFEIISRHHGEKMYPGQILEYRVRPFWNIPMYWMTEITHVAHLQYFIDEQRFGPYRFWHHQHHFREVNDGVEMTDIVHWRNPLGFVGDIANRLFVRSRLDNIFSYRYAKIEALFGKPVIP